jgi:hypothetical protein
VVQIREHSSHIINFHAVIISIVFIDEEDSATESGEIKGERRNDFTGFENCDEFVGRAFLNALEPELQR